jgi:predicted RNA binding protein YcfA (HicA-like mRNA interferase family)
MKQYTQLEFIKVVRRNGFFYNRRSGDHAIYVNNRGRHISIPHKLESVIARRLIKENNLDVNIKRRRK